jgi:hypothetical protein
MFEISTNWFNEMTDKQSPREEAVDPFLKTMTFASGRRYLPSCDCDECGLIRTSEIPEPIRRAVQEHKKWRKLRRSQVRQLLHRGRHVVLWRWTLPKNAEPLIEYGNPDVHRLIWVKRLAPGTVLKRIGSGVVGSASEEKSRIAMPWTQGSVVHVSSGSRMAVGWVTSVVGNDSDVTAREPRTNVDATISGSPIVLYIAKVSCTEGSTSVDEDTDERLATIRKICLLNKIGNDDALRDGKVLSTDDAESFQQAFESFVGSVGE